MFGRIPNLLLSGCAAAAAIAVGVSCAPSANAQTYNDQPPPYADQPAPYGGYDSAADDGTQVGEIVVTPSYRPDRDENGIPTERVYASRVVPISDLDLSTD
jgi:hypothetical protein